MAALIRLTILVIALAATASPTLARKAVLIGMFDTNDAQAGVAIEANRRQINEFYSFIRSNLGSDWQVEVYDFSGSQFTMDAVRAAVNPMRFTQDDVVILYYTGHGVDDTTPGESLQMLQIRDVASSTSQYRARTIANALVSRNPGLILAVFEACNFTLPLALIPQPRTFNNATLDFIRSVKGHWAIATASDGQLSHMNVSGGWFGMRFLDFFASSTTFSTSSALGTAFLQAMDAPLDRTIQGQAYQQDPLILTLHYTSAHQPKWHIDLNDEQ